MDGSRSPISPDGWLHDLFACKAVQQGGVIRRKTRDVDRFVGMDRFLREIDRRGFQVVENGGQLVIFCNQGPLRWLTPRRDAAFFQRKRTEVF